MGLGVQKESWVERAPERTEQKNRDRLLNRQSIFSHSVRFFFDRGAIGPRGTLFPSFLPFNSTQFILETFSSARFCGTFAWRQMGLVPCAGNRPLRLVLAQRGFNGPLAIAPWPGLAHARRRFFAGEALSKLNFFLSFWGKSFLCQKFSGNRLLTKA